MKTTRFSAEALRAPSTLRCHNLRPDPGRPGVLRPAGVPATVAPAGHRPLLHFATADGMRLLTAVGRTLYISAGTASGAPVQAVATLGAEPLCAVYASGRVIVMTDAGPEQFSYPSFRAEGSGGAASAGVALRAVPGPRALMAEVAPRTLSSDYRRASTLSARDAAAVGSDLRAAYAQLALEASAQAVMMQPALARYRLLDASGRTLFTSAPVLLGTAQCVAAQRLTLADDCLLRGYMLSAASWRMQLDIPAGIPADVCSVSVSVTPQLHPVDASAEASVLLSVQPLSTLVSVGLASSGIAVLPTATAASARTVLELMARMDALERTVATLPATPGSSVEIAVAPVMEPQAEIAAVKAAMRRAVDSVPYAVSRVAAPHGFAARCAAVAGETIAWAGISAIPYAGYPLGQLAAAFDDGSSWSAYTAVEMADGSRAVWTGGGSSGAPALLHPVLSYPAPDAVSLTIGLRVGAELPQVRTFALTPLPGGSAAAYVDPSLAPFALDGAKVAALQPPEPSAPSAGCGGMVVAADASAPFVARAACTLPGDVLRILPAACGAAGWDFGRTRFMAFGPAGIDYVTLGAARRDTVATLSTGHRDSRAVMAAEAVAEGADGVVYALAGGDLLRLSAGAATTMLHGTGYTALAYDCARDELWCMAPSSDTALVLCPGARPLRAYTRPSGAVQAVLGGAGGSFVLTATGLSAVHLERPAAVRVEWAGCFDAPGAARWSPRAVLVRAPGSGVDMEVELAAGELAAEPVPTARVRLRGDVRAAVRLPLLSRSLRSVRLAVCGTVNPDFSLSHFDLL